MGDDENGDGHLLAADELDRARAAPKAMQKRCLNVRGNWAAEKFARERLRNPSAFTLPMGCSDPDAITPLAPANATASPAPTTTAGFTLNDQRGPGAPPLGALAENRRTRRRISKLP